MKGIDEGERGRREMMRSMKGEMHLRSMRDDMKLMVAPSNGIKFK
jgi:hypothetical protein